MLELKTHGIMKTNQSLLVLNPYFDKHLYLTEIDNLINTYMIRFRIISENRNRFLYFIELSNNGV